MLISSGSPNSGVGAINTYQNMVKFIGMEDMGIITAAGEENGSEEKLAEIRAFAEKL